MKDTQKLIRDLLLQKNQLNESLANLDYSGTVEIKTNSAGKKYIYLRRRNVNRIESKYVGVYSDELYSLVYKQCKKSKEIVKQIRKIEHELFKIGYNEAGLSNKVLLNIDIAHSHFTMLIHNQGILEGIHATYLQTQTILDNGNVNGLRPDEITKIINLKNAWSFVLDKDVIKERQDFYLYQNIAKLVNTNLLTFPDKIRTTKVRIAGCNYEPPIPFEVDVKQEIKNIVNKKSSAIDIAINLCLYCMKRQIFNDGNKRSAVIFANHFLISKGGGLIIIQERDVNKFKELLCNYYDRNEIKPITNFLKNKCWIKMK